MSDYRFDASKSFEDNVEDFLGHLNLKDPKMTRILKANLDILLSSDTDDIRRRRNREQFNKQVTAALSEHSNEVSPRA